MAFPLPTHLPRKKDARDVSTQILTKISETSSKTLNAQLASSWVAELDDTIKATKTRIHERIAGDLPNFERQLATSVSVQERLQSLSRNVDTLSESISHPQSGLIPNLVTTLASHAALAQENADVRAQHAALAHLLRCRNELRHLTGLVQKAELADATRASSSLGKCIDDAPEPLAKSEVMADMKRKSTALRNRTEEQLLDAYSRSIVVSQSEVVVKPYVQAVLPRRQINGSWAPSMLPQDNIDTTIRLPDVLASMTPAALSMHLATLRRDITTHCIEYTMKQPIQIYQTDTTGLTGTSQYKLSMQRAPPGVEDLSLRLANLTTVMAFLHSHLFPHLPPAERTSFPLSLCAPIRSAILNQLLLPNLPSTLSKLPDFLSLAKQAAQLEDEVVIQMLGDNGADRSIKSWVDNVGLHYERKRRAAILDRARAIVVSPPDDSTTFRVEVPLIVENVPIPVNLVDKPVTNGKHPEPVAADDDAWGFGDESPSQGNETSSQSDETSTDEWGFDDDIDPEPTPEPEPVPEPSKASVPESSTGTEDSTEDDPWGWNDDTEPTEPDDGSAWDDAWDEKPSAPEPVPPSPAPKPAKGLEKRFGGKSVPNSPAFPPPQSPAAPVHSSPPPPPPVASRKTKHTPVPPPLLIPATETYAVSGRTKDLLQLVEDVLREGAELVSSGILGGTPGSVIMQAAPMALELFRALVPVTNATVLKQSAKEPMRFSNDCLFVSHELRRIAMGLTGPKASARGKLEEGMERLRVLADSWFEETIAREERLIDELLDHAKGFIDTTHQERYDECEGAVNGVLQRIRRVAPQWKAVLTKSRYYDALGSIVEAALSRILGDILALEDITEVESHRLSELCHILNALEGLFMEDPEQPSFVVSHVPSWLKFSYLSELLEASIADISYLFEEGALVDFEIEELVKLVKALFADTPLRANTITKLQQGHPVRGS
ncbi:hypothetical protein L226DRAFT_510672 [Lentinus tigrinus ALCF2SS1-7]|uniref:ZW10 C-terminal helical domain-containing protein n=1 Tax=Lentinus tigrinus ALCF2SS1-6 TaxID=1328759 RepID=A0A5C2S5V8_9APHY|nr:hypothetical protein L227DRAFT_528220 [Lentinus tigrinus ALCF2SS1-6]RPD73274.1 hypothetical protein L226DRAFT_510672 [Lentinus tigrinus ALCF2SS1-7]